MKQKQQKMYKLPKKRQPFFSFIKRILRLFYKKPKIIYVGDEIKNGSIIVSNHCSMKGPLIHELYLPAFCIKWGAGEMLGGYKMRYRYLRNVYFMRKKGYGKFAATICAAFDALFSKFFYKGIKVIPTWHDARLVRTVSCSINALNNDISVMIFPENSDNGYQDDLTEFHAGFVALAELYYKQTEKDVPIYPVYYHNKTNVMVIGEPQYIQSYIEQGLNKTQIAEEFRKIVNNLYSKYIINDDAVCNQTHVINEKINT